MKGHRLTLLAMSLLSIVTLPISSHAQYFDWALGSAVVDRPNGEQVIFRALGEFSADSFTTPGNKIVTYEGTCANCLGWIEVPCNSPSRIDAVIDDQDNLTVASVACLEEVGSSGSYQTRIYSGPIMYFPLTGTPTLVPIQQDLRPDLFTGRIRQLKIHENNNRRNHEIAIAMEIVHSHEGQDLSSPYQSGDAVAFSYVSRELWIRKFQIQTNVSSPWLLTGTYQTEREVATFGEDDSGNLYIATCGDEARQSAFSSIGLACYLEDVQISKLSLFGPTLSTFGSSTLTPTPLAEIEGGQSTPLTWSGSTYGFMFNFGFNGNLAVLKEPITGRDRLIMDLRGVHINAFALAIPGSLILPQDYGALSVMVRDDRSLDVARVGTLAYTGAISYETEPNSCGTFIATYYESSMKDPNEIYAYDGSLTDQITGFSNWGQYHDEIGFAQSFNTPSPSVFYLPGQKPQLDNQGRVWNSDGSTLGSAAPDVVAPSCP